ncbi:hypothetical protein M5D96_002434 [Drosophila gunungcola]|uniref:Uncharacterized protein n=1 Tax=Drosophila gunungcola TaxID=103775 RepID=A0A9Q0BVH7_9MUSC|nr:hypothetical protein M5D96_002434 [Drosophila gunungcola]
MPASRRNLHVNETELCQSLRLSLADFPSRSHSWPEDDDINVAADGNDDHDNHVKTKPNQSQSQSPRKEPPMDLFGA